MPNPALFHLAYAGPVYYYQEWVKHKERYVDAASHFQKQTYRNRCVILSSGGPLSLVIPVKHTFPKIPAIEVQIDYREAWQKKHLRSLEAAYNKSPFFGFYYDALCKLYQTQITLLIDWNRAIHQLLCGIMKLPADYTLENRFLKLHPPAYTDCRLLIECKKNTTPPAFRYNQVFDFRFGFTPGLSIFDLCFNEGRNAGEMLHLA